MEYVPAGDEFNSRWQRHRKSSTYELIDPERIRLRFDPFRVEADLGFHPGTLSRAIEFYACGVNTAPSLTVGLLPQHLRCEASPCSLRRRKILVYFVAAKGRAYLQLANLCRIRVELVALFVGEAKKRVCHGLAGADRADLHAVERPSDVKS